MFNQFSKLINLINALVAEWEQTSAARFHNLPLGVEADVEAYRCPWFSTSV